MPIRADPCRSVPTIAGITTVRRMTIVRTVLDESTGDGVVMTQEFSSEDVGAK
jgi:hypothetical protein